MAGSKRFNGNRGFRRREGILRLCGAHGAGNESTIGSWIQRTKVLRFWDVCGRIGVDKQEDWSRVKVDRKTEEAGQARTAGTMGRRSDRIYLTRGTPPDFRLRWASNSDLVQDKITRKVIDMATELPPELQPLVEFSTDSGPTLGHVFRKKTSRTTGIKYVSIRTIGTGRPRVYMRDETRVMYVTKEEA